MEASRTTGVFRSPGARKSRTFTEALAVLLVLAVVLSGCGAPVPVESELTVGLGDSAERSQLDGATVQGDILVVVPPRSQYRGVAFFIDSATEPAALVLAAPYEFRLDTRTLTNGAHRVTAFAFIGGGGKRERVAEATFNVSNPQEEGRQTEPADPSEPTDPSPPGDPIDPADPSEPSDPALPNDPVDPADPSEPADPTPPTAPAPSDPIVPLPPAPTTEYAHLRQLFVSPNGADSSDGSAATPLRTVSEGVRRALFNRSNGYGTRINLLDGIYREGVTRYSATSGPLIVIQAINQGEAIISGADVFTQWSCGGGVCEHAWAYAWGPAQDPWGRGIGELALRREIVVVNGVNFGQVLSRSALTAGTFYVDEGQGKLFLRPAAGSTVQGSIVEVAVRPHLLRLQALNDLVIKGVRFQHAASPFTRAAVEIVDQNDVLIEDVIVEWNGQYGLWFKGSRFTVRSSVMNNNGSSGVGGFRVTDILLEDSHSSYNNWRGVRSGYDGWDVGNKFFAVHRMVIRRHTSTHNQSRGFWFDIDIEDVLIEDSIFSDNRRDGMFIEKVHGPIVVRNSEFSRNGNAGIVTSALNEFTLERSRLERNATSAVNISGEFNVTYTNFETGRSYTLNNSRWTWRDNTMTAWGTSPIITTTHPTLQWDRVISTSAFDLNGYSAGIEQPFRDPTAHLSFAQWRVRTGQDLQSGFTMVLAGQ